VLCVVFPHARGGSWSPVLADGWGAPDFYLTVSRSAALAPARTYGVGFAKTRSLLLAVAPASTISHWISHAREAKPSAVAHLGRAGSGLGRFYFALRPLRRRRAAG
jgi:hypothetical protein